MLRFYFRDEYEKKVVRTVLSKIGKKYMKLYKVTSPKKSNIFEPATFYRSHNFCQSSTKYKVGCIRDKLLYAADFEGVVIHLMPDIYRLLVKNSSSNFEKLQELGFSFSQEISNIIFVEETNLNLINEFTPTVYFFDSINFTKTPSGEYVSNKPVKATGMRKYSMDECIAFWKIQLIGVKCLKEIKVSLEKKGVLFSSQD